MEMISFLLLVIILIVLLVFRSDYAKQIDQLHSDLRKIRRKLEKISEEGKEASEAGKEVFAEKIPPVVIQKTESVTPLEKRNVPEIKNEEIKSPAIAAVKEVKPGFFERYPDLEKFIGENLISKIGIAILVLGIGFFVKYAIDKDWIGATGRVAIGIAAGAILISLAHRLRNTYQTFSSILAGGGLATFYFTIMIAFQQFHLFSQTVSFIIMIVITTFAVALSLLYDRQELSIIALAGGFASPFLVSNGNNNYIALFTYLIILNSGLLVIAYKKAWRVMNALAFFFTALIFAGWLWQLDYNAAPLIWRNGFIFGNVFYVMFLVINIAHNIKEKRKFLITDFALLLLNTCIFFGAGLYCIDQMQHYDMRGIYCAAMGLFNLVVSYFLFRTKKTDINILYLLIGITLTFISLTAPLQLHGHYITMFWASEAVLLYWLSSRSGMSLIKYSALFIWLLMLISLGIDWTKLYLFTDESLVLPIILNKGFVTTVFAAVASYVLYLLIQKDRKDDESMTGNAVAVTSVVLLYMSGFWEIRYQFTDLNGVNDMYLLLYSVAFAFVLGAFFYKRTPQITWLPVSGLLYVAALAYYLLQLKITFTAQEDILILKKTAIEFWPHWATAILIPVLIYRLVGLLRNARVLYKRNFVFAEWLLCIFAVIYLSIEVHLIANEMFFNVTLGFAEIQRVFIKTGLPIIWGLASFGFMWLGMHYKNRNLRIISLSLFLITLLKLFIFDIRNIPAGGKIAAFFCLGILLLIVSFMYQRLKRIIIDDEKTP